MTTVRKIVHVDMDAFFAAVEQRDFPEYRGKALIVGGSPEGRGVVATCSYEARSFGIRSAMSCAEAARRCPDAYFVPPRFEVYRAESQKIKQIYRRYTDLVEPLSLDEAYLDVTQNIPQIPSATWIAEKLRAEIFRETGLTASAGVAPLKFLAKIASDVNKPNGLFVIPPEKVHSFIETLPVGKIFGIGKKTEQKMHRLGIKTGGDLRQMGELELVRKFGRSGQHYFRLAQGIDDRLIQPHRVRKSISVEETYEADLTSAAEVEIALRSLIDRLCRRIEKVGRGGRTLVLKVRYSDFTTVSKSRSFPSSMTEAKLIVPQIKELLNAALDHQSAIAIRLLGVGIENLSGSTGAEDEPQSKYAQQQTKFDF